MSNDDVIILIPNNDDDDCTVFQTDEERKRLEKEILGLEDTTVNEMDDTTIQMTRASAPDSYWRSVFG